ncbi:MAG: hypothetical protein AAGA03_15920, partial [Planctomycetota bacterium]
DANEPLERFRKSFWQGSELRSGYLGDLGDAGGGLNRSFWEANVAMAVPLGSLTNLKNVLVIRPQFRADYLDGPTAIDVPETLYSTGVLLLNRYQWTSRLSTLVSVTPSVRSDFTTSQDAVRVMGFGLVNWDAIPKRLALSAGAVYLDRSDLSVLPAIGLTWTPSPDLRIELMAPKPRIAKRFFKDGPREERWGYVAATIGGNSWAVSRSSGANDVLTLSEFRLLLGYERLRAGNRGWSIETGWAFDRSIEYDNQPIDINLDDAVFIEASLRF